MTANINFALNHMVAPRLDIRAFFELATRLGTRSVEIRNDLSGSSDIRNVSAASVKSAAADTGVEIISINALQRWNQWNADKAAEARQLIEYAAACGAGALVLVPTNDTAFTPSQSERKSGLAAALKALKPMLDDNGVQGLVEPLGFAECSLRFKKDAIEAINAAEAADTFRLVHDTFHHFVAGETELHPHWTGIVHISGVTDPHIPLRDPRRTLVTPSDRIDNVGQIRALIGAGYRGPVSFEPFAAEVHDLANPEQALRDSMGFIDSLFPA